MENKLKPTNPASTVAVLTVCSCVTCESVLTYVLLETSVSSKRFLENVVLGLHVPTVSQKLLEKIPPNQWFNSWTRTRAHDSWTRSRRRMLHWRRTLSRRSLNSFGSWQTLWSLLLHSKLFSLCHTRVYFRSVWLFSSLLTKVLLPHKI